MALNPDSIRHGGVGHRAAWRQAMMDLWKYIKHLKSIPFNFFKLNTSILGLEAKQTIHSFNEALYSVAGGSVQQSP
jgi:hypothetical protein